MIGVCSCIDITTSEVAGPLPSDNDHGCHQLVANPVQGIAKADREENRGTFRNSEIGGPIVALVAPLQRPGVSGVGQRQVVWNIPEPEENARHVTRIPYTITGIADQLIVLAKGRPDARRGQRTGMKQKYRVIHHPVHELVPEAPRPPPRATWRLRAHGPPKPDAPAAPTPSCPRA